MSLVDNPACCSPNGSPFLGCLGDGQIVQRNSPSSLSGSLRALMPRKRLGIVGIRNGKALFAPQDSKDWDGGKVDEDCAGDESPANSVEYRNAAEHAATEIVVHSNCHRNAQNRADLRKLLRIPEAAPAFWAGNSVRAVTVSEIARVQEGVAVRSFTALANSSLRAARKSWKHSSFHSDRSIGTL